MSHSVLVTGATGFVGQALVSQLAAERAYKLTALARHLPEERRHEVDWLAGDLLDPATYLEALRGIETVVHLAALTGKGKTREHELVNVGGTRNLLEACKAAGVRRFVHVSTIATTYSDQRWYAYGQTKKRAEALVKQSGIPHTILRPTIVLGAQSPIWLSLARIARSPLILMPDGGRVEVQPICVVDLANCIVQLLSKGRFEGEALDLGGPTKLTFADFMRAIHKGLTGNEPRLIPVPSLPIRVLLAIAEPVALPLLPITAGQLAVFVNDGSVTPNWLHDSMKGSMCTVSEAIALLVAERPTSGA